jgi:hypothetical protein
MRVPTGVPADELEEVEGPHIKGVYITSDGRYVRIKKRCVAGPLGVACPCTLPAVGIALSCRKKFIRLCVFAPPPCRLLGLPLGVLVGVFFGDYVVITCTRQRMSLGQRLCRRPSNAHFVPPCCAKRSPSRAAPPPFAMTVRSLGGGQQWQEGNGARKA